jgi:Phytanoyl-CoA dioxygenase (PhyH)
VCPSSLTVTTVTTTATTMDNNDSDEQYQLQFQKDGYLVLRNVLPIAHVQQWSQQWAHPSFVRCIFQQLYDGGHISQPTPIMTSGSAPTVIDDKDTDREMTPVDSTHAITTTSTNARTMRDDLVATQLPPIVYTMQPGVRHGFREIVMRSPGRYEIAIPHVRSLSSSMKLGGGDGDGNDTANILTILQQYLPFVPNLLQQHQQQQQQQQQQNEMNPTTMTWQDVKIMNLSIVVSTPGSTDQKWHADGGHVNLHRHLPCHCCNVFIPLTDVTDLDGPTELRPGTHYMTRQLTTMMLLAKARRTLVSPVTPNLYVGDVLIFDYRILHRGRANRRRRNEPPSSICVPSSSLPSSRTTATTTITEQDHHPECTTTTTTTNMMTTRNRVILVVTVAVPWFHDIVNFPKRSLYDTTAAVHHHHFNETQLEPDTSGCRYV